MARSAPQNVVIMATAIAGPIADGSDRFWSIWMSPISVPTIPNAGAYMPALFRSLTSRTIGRAVSIDWVSSDSSARAVGTPSTTISRADRRMGSRASSRRPSRASGPSRRAVRAKSPIWDASAG